MNPMPLPADMEQTRRFFCSNYMACLDFTIRQGWQGFSCKECHNYELKEPDADDYVDCMLLGVMVDHYKVLRKIPYAVIRDFLKRRVL